jgi:5-methylcytosine-specific restriction endonuclease McrA
VQSDHIRNVAADGAPYDLANGQTLCIPCHKTKTDAEAQAGRARRIARAKIPSQIHPGLVTKK